MSIIEKIRKKINMSRKDFCEAVGCDKSRLSRWINGEEPSVDNAHKIIQIAREFGVKISLEQLKPPK